MRMVIKQSTLPSKHHDEPQEELTHHGITDDDERCSDGVEIFQNLTTRHLVVPTFVVDGLE